MKRCALIIEASSVPGETFLPGAVADASNYDQYLRSLAGGEWTRPEVRVLNNPKLSIVRAEISRARTADFALIAFSGHGSHVQSKNRDLDETRICLDGGEMSVKDLNCGADRCLVIVDCCRNVVLTELTKAATLNMEHFQRSAEKSTREYYDEAVMSGEKGCCTLYSCDLDEAAGETKNGGYFTRALIDHGESWYRNQRGLHGNVLRIDAAFALTSATVTTKASQQHPQAELGRRRVHFPWAVY